MRLLIALTLVFLSLSLIHDATAAKPVTLASIFPKHNEKALKAIFKYIYNHKKQIGTEIRKIDKSLTVKTLNYIFDDIVKGKTVAHVNKQIKSNSEYKKLVASIAKHNAAYKAAFMRIRKAAAKK
jgi:hypothetical protein